MLYGSIFFGMGLLAIGWLSKWFQVMDANDLVILSALLIGYTVYTLGEMIMSPVQMTFVANIAPEHLRGTYMGAANLQWITGNVFGPHLGGVLLDQLLGHILFTILGVGCIISGFVYLLLDRLIENRSKEIPIKQTS